MEGENDKPPSPKQENTESTSGSEDDAGVKKSKNLREATAHLKQEALRRYRLRHRDDQEYSSSNASGGDNTPEPTLPPGHKIPHPPKVKKSERTSQDSVVLNTNDDLGKTDEESPPKWLEIYPAGENERSVQPAENENGAFSEQRETTGKELSRPTLSRGRTDMSVAESVDETMEIQVIRNMQNSVDADWLSLASGTPVTEKDTTFEQTGNGTKSPNEIVHKLEAEMVTETEEVDPAVQRLGESEILKFIDLLEKNEEVTHIEGEGQVETKSEVEEQDEEVEGEEEVEEGDFVPVRSDLQHTQKEDGNVGMSSAQGAPAGSIPASNIDELIIPNSDNTIPGVELSGAPEEQSQGDTDKQDVSPPLESQSEEKPKEDAEVTEEAPNQQTEEVKPETEGKQEEQPGPEQADEKSKEQAPEQTEESKPQEPVAEKTEEPTQNPEQAQEGEKTTEQAPDAEKAQESEDTGKTGDEQTPQEGEKEPEQAQEGDKPQEQAQQEGDKPQEQAQQEGDKPQEQAQEEDKPQEQAQQEGDKPQEQAQQEGDKPQEQAQEGDKPQEQAQQEGDKPQEQAQQEGDKPQEQAQQEGDKPQEQAQQEGVKPQEQAQQEGDKPQEQAQQEGDKPQEQAQQEGDKPQEQAQQEGDKPQEQAQQEGDKPQEQAQQEGDKPQEQAQQEGDKPQEQAQQEGDKPQEQAQQEGDKPQEQAQQEGDKPQEQAQQEGDKPQEQAQEGKEPAEGDVNQNAAEEQKEQDQTERVSREPTEVSIPDTFYYEYDKMVSGATIMEGSGLPLDLMSLQYSFGYDCTKRANLHLLDEKTVMFAAGNLVQLVNLETREHTYLRSTSGGGIGAITVHPTRKYFAVAEKGNAPNINIFEYPSLKLYRILRGGTEKCYTYVDFNPEGELLASQGGDPDYMLTVWNWRQEKTVLRSKAFSQEIFRATFSTELEGQLTTAGTSHIRFWKMADTFTGLKLQGQLGKFGKTEITDIEGYVELPDGKVLSGSEWGNMLLWEGGLIKVEIGRKQKKPCHQGNIMQILLDEGELMTVGEDGFIRVWDFESIDTADSTDESALFEMEPMNEMRVGNDVKLNSISKSFDSESEVTYWFAQDANGGIWKLDLTFSHTSQAPDKLFTYHAGAIVGCDTSPVSHLVATTGQDHTVRVFDYAQKKQVCEMKYQAGGSSLIWAPQIVDPKGSTVIAGFSDGVVRVLNVSQLSEDAPHKRHKNDCDLLLQQAFKPHNGSVTCLAIDNKGEILVTGSADSTVFFMNIGKTYDPIGFVKLPAAIKKVQWSPDSKTRKKDTLLVFCEDGLVMEIDSPDGATFDTSSTFQISGLPMRTYNFKSVKSTLRHNEELAKKAKEEADRKRKEEMERQKRIERGLETESEQGDEQEEEKKDEEEWKPYIPSEPSPILDGFYAEDGQFWLSMGSFDSGYLYKCKFLTEEERAKYPEELVDQPIQSIPVIESNDVPVQNLKFSSNGRQVMFGMEDGSVRIYSLETEFDISTMGPYWTLNMHDNNYGHITGLSVSYDNQMVLSVGSDGNFFLYNMMQQEEIDEKTKANKAKIPSARKTDADVIIDDIDDPNAYSIEDAKQKAEHDKMMRLADEKKKEVRRQITKLRRQFKLLLEKNDNLPSHLQLMKDEFEMDREIKEELEKQKRERIELVRKENAWQAEKHRIALEKLRKRFKDVVECERIVVKAFKTKHEVASFRAAKLSDDFYTLKAEFERKRTMTAMRDDITRDPTRDIVTENDSSFEKKIDNGVNNSDCTPGQTRHSDSTAKGDQTADPSGAKVLTTLKGSMGERISKALGKVEEKKKKRAQRKAQWEELYNTKPDDDYEDPADKAAIKEAKDNMGDYKLKTAKDYVVPDHLRMNVEKARGRLLVLKDLIHEHKYHFNLRLLSLRDKKIHVIEEIKDLVEQLEDIQTKIVPEKRNPVPPVPHMHRTEMPERKLEYTRETLLAFKKEMERKEEEKKKGGDFGGFGGFGGGDKGGSVSPAPVQKPTIDSSKTTKAAVEEPQEESKLSPLEAQIKIAQEIRNLYEQDRLLQRIEELLKNFDAELRLLRHDKFKLDIVMKNADLRQVTLFEEFVLLKEYEKREDILAAKVTGKQQEKLDMQNRIIDVQNKLEMKKKEIEKLQERDRQLNSKFQTSLGDNNKFADYLTKVFKKKIKRSKKKTTEEGSDDDSDEDSDDDSDWDEDEDEDDEDAIGYDLDVCPPGCDQNLYDNTCQLRETRLDIEEGLTEEKKNNDSLKKELESLHKKAKIIDNNLKTAQNDLEAFQLEKQQKLNELDVIVTLKLHQIQYMINGMLPQDLSQTLVFESNGVVRLQQRIKELEYEKHSQKKHMKESKRKHVQLIKDRKIFDQKIIELEEECKGMMVAKFGREVDLEKLETITVNRQIEELKEKLRMTEIQCSEEMNEWDEKILEKKSRITSLIRDNTNRLNQLCVLMNEQKSFESSLDVRQKNSGEEFSGQRKSDIREKQRLIQLVQLQAQEIDALKEEIMLLSRKGGHILPPAQPPLPQSPQNMRTISN